MLKQLPQEHQGPLVKLGSGELGGKARGLSFLESLLDMYGIRNEFSPHLIKVPETTVLATGEFERFVDRNNLAEVMESNNTNPWASVTWYSSPSSGSRTPSPSKSSSTPASGTGIPAGSSTRTSTLAENANMARDAATGNRNNARARQARATMAARGGPLPPTAKPRGGFTGRGARWRRRERGFGVDLPAFTMVPSPAE